MTAMDYRAATIYTDMGDLGELPVEKEVGILAGSSVVSIVVKRAPGVEENIRGRFFTYDAREYFLHLNKGLTGEEKRAHGNTFSQGGVYRIVSKDEKEKYILRYVARGYITFE